MAGKWTLATINVTKAAFGQFPKRFVWDGLIHTVHSVIQTWTVNTGANPHFRFLVTIGDGSQVNIYRFVRDGTVDGDLWKIDVTEKVEA